MSKEFVNMENFDKQKNMRLILGLIKSSVDRIGSIKNKDIENFKRFIDHVENLCVEMKIESKTVFNNETVKVILQSKIEELLFSNFGKKDEIIDLDNFLKEKGLEVRWDSRSIKKYIRMSMFQDKIRGGDVKPFQLGNILKVEPDNDQAGMHAYLESQLGLFPLSFKKVNEELFKFSPDSSGNVSLIGSGRSIDNIAKVLSWATKSKTISFDDKRLQILLKTLSVAMANRTQKTYIETVFNDFVRIVKLIPDEVLKREMIDIFRDRIKKFSILEKVTPGTETLFEKFEQELGSGFSEEEKEAYVANYISSTPCSRLSEDTIAILQKLTDKNFVQEKIAEKFSEDINNLSENDGTVSIFGKILDMMRSESVKKVGLNPEQKFKLYEVTKSIVMDVISEDFKIPTNGVFSLRTMFVALEEIGIDVKNEPDISLVAKFVDFDW